MRRASAIAAFAFAAAALAATPSWALKRVSYPEVRVTALPAIEPDAGLVDLRQRLAAAVAARDVNALVAMVAANFEWTAAGLPTDEFDAKRGAEHNFRVAFGFRAPGRDADGQTDIGPQWELLAFFASDPVLTQEKGSPLVCGSTTAKVADLGALDTAFNRIDEENDLSEWVYSPGEVQLTAEPSGGTVIATVKSVALPIVGVFPEPKDGDAQPPAPTHFELLLPSGKTGWAAVGSVRPLFVDRLCFAKDKDGWKIALYDQAE